MPGVWPAMPGMPYPPAPAVVPGVWAAMPGMPYHPAVAGDLPPGYHPAVAGARGVPGAGYPVEGGMAPASPWYAMPGIPYHPAVARGKHGGGIGPCTSGLPTGRTPLQRDWQSIAKQPAPAPHMLRIVLRTVPRAGRLQEHHTSHLTTTHNTTTKYNCRGYSKLRTHHTAHLSQRLTPPRKSVTIQGLRESKDTAPGAAPPRRPVPREARSTPERGSS